MKDKEMKDKEMIEEMAKHGCYDGCASGLRKFCDEYDGKPCKNMVRIANGLYEQGYRKLTEDSVVLSKEEYEKVDKEIINKSTYDTIWKAGYNAYEKTIGECVAEARKETAEKFAEMLKEELENCSAIDGYDLEDLEFDGEIIQQCIDKILSEIRQMLR